MENNIKIISKYSVIKEFNSPEEFDKYYLKHKEEINFSGEELDDFCKVAGLKCLNVEPKHCIGFKDAFIFGKCSSSTQRSV